jgi:outer membrane receptor protein involved in Fe transport
MKKTYTNLLAAFLLIISTAAFAQTGVGKISGRILDAATGEPLIGANIILLNTNLGAATDIEGNYFILNITPGTYAVKVSYVGYAPKTVEGVRVVANITYELNVDLSTDFTLDEIIVVDRKFFEEKSTNTIKVVDPDQISRLPVKGIQNVMSLQSGVVVQEGSGGQDGNAVINVRGGRGGEVLYIVDGVPQNNILNNNNRTQVSDNSIQQASFQVGGYEAKYGQAQSGIVNITTKSGQSFYDIFTDVVTSTKIDDYDYNLYTVNVSGPIIPGIPEHTIFLSGERSWLKDGNPPAIPMEFPTIGTSSKFSPENESQSWRLTGRTTSNMGSFKLNLGANYSKRDYRLRVDRYTKNNPRGNPLQIDKNLSFSGRLSQTVSNSSFWNLNFGYRKYSFEQADKLLGDDLFLYGDSTYLANTLGITLLRDGTRDQYDPVTGGSFTLDENGVYFPYGRINNVYQKNEDAIWNLDADFTTQLDNHLLEIGAGANLHTLRYYYINPIGLKGPSLAGLPEDSVFLSVKPNYYGYGVTGRDETNSSSADTLGRPREPIFAYAYLQDRFELEDLVINLGLRVDYYDYNTLILRDPALPYAGGIDPNDYDLGSPQYNSAAGEGVFGDFIEKEAEIELSPRIGLGFPITETTTFHAQYGRFMQNPALIDMYTGPLGLSDLIIDDARNANSGAIIKEATTQYEIGFRQLLGNNAAMNITLFYKNIKGLINRGLQFFAREPDGEQFEYYDAQNTDFGTSKGIAFSLDITRMSYFSVSLQYTFAIAEGTGSTTSSSSTAVFRNVDNEVPKVIAPLDFDQAHTGTFVVDFFIPRGEGGIFELTGLNVLFSFASGRPYTPLDYFDILSGNNGGPSTTGYINSRNMAGLFRLDLKLEKSFAIGDNFIITPYFWVLNALGSENVTNVWRSTGDPYSTGWLNTAEGQLLAERSGQGYVDDYQSLERDPDNFGIPRMMRLGLKLNLTNLGL